MHVAAPKTETEQATASANLETKRGPRHVSLRSNYQLCRWSRQALPFNGFAAGDPSPHSAEELFDWFFCQGFHHKLHMVSSALSPGKLKGPISAAMDKAAGKAA